MQFHLSAVSYPLFAHKAAENITVNTTVDILQTCRWCRFKVSESLSAFYSLFPSTFYLANVRSIYTAHFPVPRYKTGGRRGGNAPLRCHPKDLFDRHCCHCMILKRAEYCPSRTLFCHRVASDCWYSSVVLISVWDPRQQHRTVWLCMHLPRHAPR
jgi:hypothetical protein